LNTWADAFFKVEGGEGDVYFGVIFSYSSLTNEKVGIKLGFDNNVFDTLKLDYFFQNTFFYAVDEDGNRVLDQNGIEIQVPYNSFSSELKFGQTTFEIVTENINFDFKGIEMFI
jgi:hypothetical protein